jgi:hypothetical protein
MPLRENLRFSMVSSLLVFSWHYIILSMLLEVRANISLFLLQICASCSGSRPPSIVMLFISLVHISNDFFRDWIGNLQFTLSTLSEEKGTQQFPLPVLASKVCRVGCEHHQASAAPQP